MNLLEQMPDRHIDTEENVYGTAKDPSQQGYPSGPEYALSELSQAYRLASSEAAASRPMMIIGEGRALYHRHPGRGA